MNRILYKHQYLCIKSCAILIFFSFWLSDVYVLAFCLNLKLVFFVDGMWCHILNDHSVNVCSLLLFSAGVFFFLQYPYFTGEIWYTRVKLTWNELRCTQPSVTRNPSRIWNFILPHKKSWSDLNLHCTQPSFLTKSETIVSSKAIWNNTA